MHRFSSDIGSFIEAFDSFSISLATHVGTRIPPANALTDRVKTRILAQESNDRYDVHGGLGPGDFGDDIDCFSKLSALFNFPGAFVGATSLTYVKDFFLCP